MFFCMIIWNCTWWIFNSCFNRDSQTEKHTWFRTVCRFGRCVSPWLSNRHKNYMPIYSELLLTSFQNPPLRSTLPCYTVKIQVPMSGTEIRDIFSFEISTLNKYKNKYYTTFAVHRKSASRTLISSLLILILVWNRISLNGHLS